MAVYIVLRELCLLQCLNSGHIGILCFLGHHLSHIAAQHFLEFGLGHVGADGRTETRILALLTEHNATLSFVQRLAYLIECRADARPDAHSCNNNSSFHNYIISLITFL